MKIFSSSPYAPFNSKEWNSLVSKSDKFVNTPIKLQKKYLKTSTIQKIEKDKSFNEKSESHKQMRLVFA